MYYDFFGFREPPFSIAPDPRYLYLSERHKEALAHLMYGVQGQGGFIVITGEVGTGKTTVSRCFIENVPDHVDIALILNPRLSARELLAAICDELGIAYPPNATIKPLVDCINQHLLQAHARGRHQVLMIDEAQNLSADVLEQLRLLTNLETAQKKLLQIVLLGQPELQELLERPELRQLNQRVTARYHLDALERDELPAYLHYRLGVAGVKVDLFTPAAVRVLYRKSAGVPRLINLISDRALLGAYAEGVHLIEPRHIRLAAREMGLGEGTKNTGKGIPPVLRYLTMVTAAAALAVLGLAFLENEQHSPLTMDTVPMVLADDVGVIDARPRETIAVVSGEIRREDAGAAEPEPADRHAFSFSDHALSTAQAYRRLFSLWDTEWDQRGTPFACDFAAEVGLRCLHRQGSRRSLEELDHPAVLELRDARGERRYVTLAGLDGDRATIMGPDGPVVVSFEDLQGFWFGQFSIVWRLPPYMQDQPAQGPGSSEGVWLSARMMQLVSLHTSDNREQERVSRLVRDEQVRWYQQLKGLDPDGVVGAMTLIQMSNDLDTDIPRLSDTGIAGAGQGQG